MSYDEKLYEFPTNPEGWKDEGYEARHDESISVEYDETGLRPDQLALWAMEAAAERDSIRGARTQPAREVSSLEELYRDALEVRFGPWSEEGTLASATDDPDPEAYFEAVGSPDLTTAIDKFAG
jgi:hypothetical protein